MYSTTDRVELIAGLADAATKQDAREINRLADHGLDLGIISGYQARKVRSLGEAIYSSTRSEAGRYVAALATLIATF